MDDDYEYNDQITDYNYVLSTVGNAYFSGLSFKELWDCVLLSENREQLDTAVDVSIKLKEIVKDNK
jgi:hypothetical protein